MSPSNRAKQYRAGQRAGEAFLVVWGLAVILTGIVRASLPWLAAAALIMFLWR